MSHKHKSSEPPRNTETTRPDKPNESVEKHTHRTDDDDNDEPDVKSSFNASQIKNTRILRSDE